MARVCLTFDNGPDEVGTPRVLEVLERYGVRSTFFALGRQLEAPGGLELARRIRDAGHRLGNHTFSHVTPLGRDLRPDAVELELERTHAWLAEVWDGPWFFRPFDGQGEVGPHLLSPAAVAWLEAKRYSCVLWTSVPRDFADPTAWVERALADCDREDEVLMVLHDNAREATLQLDGFVSELLERGHELVDTFPKRCILIDRGVVQPNLAPYVGQGSPS